jgi:hypothetical protein
MKNNKITVYYFGDFNSTFYPYKVMTVNALAKYHAEHHKYSKDIAFILDGVQGEYKADEMYALHKYSKFEMLNYAK